jgi:hypothetical protein
VILALLLVVLAIAALSIAAAVVAATVREPDPALIPVHARHRRTARRH